MHWTTPRISPAWVWMICCCLSGVSITGPLAQLMTASGYCDNAWQCKCPVLLLQCTDFFRLLFKLLFGPGHFLHALAFFLDNRFRGLVDEIRIVQFRVTLIKVAL